VRLGVFGSLSKMISVMANTLRIITAGSEPTRDSGRLRVSQPRCTAHATAAGGVSERNPAKSPIRNANNSVIFLVQPVFETYSAISINIWFNGKNTKHQTEGCEL
jgi:hypothetical protein